jgi:hypothetical protein
VSHDWIHTLSWILNILVVHAVDDAHAQPAARRAKFAFSAPAPGRRFVDVAGA